MLFWCIWVTVFCIVFFDNRNCTIKSLIREKLQEPMSSYWNDGLTKKFIDWKGSLKFHFRFKFHLIREKPQVSMSSCWENFQFTIEHIQFFLKNWNSLFKEIKQSLNVCHKQFNKTTHGLKKHSKTSLQVQVQVSFLSLWMKVLVKWWNETVSVEAIEKLQGFSFKWWSSTILSIIHNLTLE